ncbi:hypothetical protein H0H93_006585 [Arthromyces matolae]|nr:hypothetical protein H0H93_006585 [Arthromyces matolae]
MERTYVRLPTNAFIAFTLAIAACQAAVDSYLQTSVFAVASLYGPQALQATMSGQAAVAVAVSAVQVMSTAIFVQKRISHVVDLHQDIDGQEDTSSARWLRASSSRFQAYTQDACCAFGKILVPRSRD